MFFTTLALSIVALVMIIFIARGMKKKEHLSPHEYVKEKKEGLID